MTDGRLIHFLLVEDNDQHAKLIQRSLETNRIVNTLIRVKDGEQALAYLTKKEPYQDSTRPDVILLDLKLPKIDGHEVLRRVKNDEDLKMIPVVILTTSERPLDRQKAYDDYVNSYLVKPVDFTEFQKVVAELGYYWGVWNQTADLG